MAINLELQNAILSKLEDGLKLNELASIKGFNTEIKTLENDGKIRVDRSVEPGESSYDVYVITSYGRNFLS